MNKRIMATKSRGVAALELALILPLLCMMIFAVVDIGRLVNARLIVTDLSREGANLASRDLKSGTDLLTYLTDSSSPLNMAASGKIYVTTITAGTTARSPDPTIASQISTGALSVTSGINAGAADLGLSAPIYSHLVYNAANQVPDILGVAVVEVFYDYTPITPLAQFVPGLLGGDTVIASKAVFCISGGM